MDIILYAIIAAAIAYRLYTLLGQRHEDGRQRPNPFSFTPPPQEKIKKDEKPEKQKDEREADILAFPVGARDDMAPNPFVLAGPAPESLAGGLHAMRLADPSFDEKQFLRGARMAFEMIVHAFAAGEREALRNLMSARLYESFERGIAARETAGEKLDVQMLNVRDADIVAAKLENGNASITVQFVSDQKKAVTARDGAVDAGAVEQLTDIWTFRRKLPSPDPNWLLIETRSV